MESGLATHYCMFHMSISHTHMCTDQGMYVNSSNWLYTSMPQGIGRAKDEEQVIQTNI